MNPHPHLSASRMIKDITRYVWIAAAAWTLVIAGLFAWNLWQTHQITQKTAIIEARANFNKDQAFRYWATSHGGVYVPIDAKTPPNPYLSHVPERDIETPSGLKLTLMNPAYIVRQMNEEFADFYGVAGHITSLNLLRPENAPDEWERAALESFEQGRTEALEFTPINGQPYLRLMQPMITQEGCLKCHGHQGYQVGDIRGGVAVALPLTPLLTFERQANVTSALTFGLLWLLGIVGIVMSGRSFNRYVGEHNRAVVELEQAHNLLRQERDMFVSGSVVVFKWQNMENWPVEYVSANVAEILGHTAEELMRGDVLYAGIIHQEDIIRVANEVATHSQNHTERFEHQPYRLIRPGGDIVWVLDYTTILRDETGNITHYLGYLVDITAWKKVEEALHESEERLEMALKGADLGTWDWNIQTGEVVLNERWAEMLGYTLEEVEPHVNSWKKLMHPDEVPRVMAALTDHLAGRTPIYQTEHRLRTKSGEWRWILDTGKVLMRDEAGHPIRAAGTHQDVTERKQMEQRLIRQERLAAVGQLSAGIAHDFNNILASILLHVELLQQTPNLPKMILIRLSNIAASGQQAAHLVRQILDFSQKTIRRPQDVDLASFMEKIPQFLTSILPENIQIDLDVDPGDYLIEGDTSQLQQLITNLAVNARYAMPGGGVLRIGLSRGVCDGRYRCEMCGQPITGEWVQLQVADTGSGIPANILPRIFEPFFTTREVGEGSGLGLSQVAGILAQHGGHTSVESEMKKGSTFTVYLPPSGSAEKHVSPELAPVEEGHGETILLVEDDTAVMQATVATLEFLGYQVITAATGTEAIDLFAEHKTQIALVLSDMSLPDIDGAALFQHLKTEDPDLKMVVISGQRLGAREETLLAQGMVTWMQKPVSFDQLAQAIDKALASRRGRWD